MRIAATLPEHVDIVEAVLDGFVQAAQLMVEAGAVPAHPRETNVRYQEERGTENWLLPNQVVQAGWGDCEDLAIWAAAGYRATGEDTEARVALLQTGPRRVHAVVQHGDGSYEDVARTLVTRASSILGAAPPRSGQAIQVRVHPGSGVDAFAGLPPAAAPPGGGTPTDPTLKAALDLAAWMQEHGKSDVTIHPGYTPNTKDKAPADFQRLAQALSQRMRGEVNLRDPMKLQQDLAASQGMQNAAAVSDVVRTGDAFGQVRTRNVAQPTAVDPYGNPVDAYGNPVDAYGNPIDPYTGLPIGTGYGYGSPYGGDPYAAYAFMQQYGGGQGQDYDYQALADMMYEEPGVTGAEQQPWQVDVDGDMDVDADDMSADWIGG